MRFQSANKIPYERDGQQCRGIPTGITYKTTYDKSQQRFVLSTKGAAPIYIDDNILTSSQRKKLQSEAFPKIKNQPTAKTRKPKTSKRKLRDRADALWSLAVRKVGHCEKCGSKENLQAHHLIRRKVYRYRWDVNNGVCLCAGCHQFNDESAHAGTNTCYRFLVWLKKAKPQQFAWMVEHNLDKRPIGTIKEESYVAIILELNDQLTKL